MEELMNILKRAVPQVDWENEDQLLDSGKITSIDVISIVSELTAALGIDIPSDEMEMDNFQSMKSIADMLERIE